MTEILDSEVITEALAVIDRALSEINQRELVSSAEVSDLLLDVRSLLSSAMTPDFPDDLDQLEALSSPA